MTAPAEVKVHPIVGLAACKAHQGMGYALWALARGMSDGSGKVDSQSLRDATAELKWPAHTWRRALAQAINAGLLAEGGGWYWFISLEKIVRLYELKDAGNYPVKVPTASMRRLSAWKSTLWSAYHSSRGDKASDNPISRRTLEDKTGVPRRTQQRLERKSKVKKQQTFKAVAKALPGTLEHLRTDNPQGNYFEKDGYVWERGSNIYTSNLVSTRRGMSRKIRRKLKSALLPTHDEQRPRLYYDNEKAAKKSLENNAEQNGKPAGMQRTLDTVYYRVTKGGGTVLFFPAH